MEIDAILEILRFSWELEVSVSVYPVFLNQDFRKMRLRSRTILNENTATPIRRRRAAPETPSRENQPVQNQVSPAELSKAREN